MAPVDFRPDEYLQSRFPEEWTRSTKQASRLLNADMDTVQLSLWHWEFLRRAPAFRRDCDRLWRKRRKRILSALAHRRNREPTGEEGGLYGCVAEELQELGFIYGLPASRTPGEGILYFCYWLDFHGLLTALGTLSSDLKSICEDWCSMFGLTRRGSGQRTFAGLPGSVLKVCESSTQETTPNGYCFQKTPTIRYEITCPEHLAERLPEFLRELPYSFRREGNTISIETQECDAGIEQLLVRHLAGELPVFLRFELRDGLRLQLDALDNRSDFILRHGKDSYYQHRKQAGKKILALEAIAGQRRKLL